MTTRKKVVIGLSILTVAVLGYVVYNKLKKDSTDLSPIKPNPSQPARPVYTSPFEIQPFNQNLPAGSFANPKNRKDD